MRRTAFVSAAVALEILWIAVVASRNTRATPLPLLAAVLLAAAMIPSKSAASPTVRQRLFVFAGFAFSVIVLSAAAVDWLPQVIIRKLAMTPAQILRPSSETGIKARMLDVRRTIVEENLVRNLRERVHVADGTPDEQRVLDLLAPLKRQLLNQLSILHQPEPWPVLLAGIGWCDQLNSVGAEMLALDFPRSQLFAVYDRQNKTSGHTVGRVWSPQRKEWLYFDLFYDDVIVYALRHREPVIVARRKVTPFAVSPYPEAKQLATFRQSADGWVLADRFPTFVGQLTSTIRRSTSRSEETAGSVAELPVASVQAVCLAPRVFPADPRLLNEFVEGRLDDLFGDEQAAIRHYERTADLARLTGASLTEKAARLFVTLKTAPAPTSVR